MTLAYNVKSLFDICKENRPIDDEDISLITQMATSNDKGYIKAENEKEMIIVFNDGSSVILVGIDQPESVRVIPSYYDAFDLSELPPVPAEINIYTGEEVYS